MRDDPPSKLERLLAGPLSAIRDVSASVLGGFVHKFLTVYAAEGWLGALLTLEPATATAVVSVGALFGFTKAFESSAKKKEARRLAGWFQKITDDQKSAFDLLREIVRGDVKVKAKLAVCEQRELAAILIEDMKQAGLLTKADLEDSERVLLDEHTTTHIYLNTLDELVRDGLIHVRRLPQMDEKLDRILDILDGWKPPALPPPTNNFADAQITRNQDFVGRDAILEQLHQRLESGRDVALRQDLPPGVEQPAGDGASHALSGEGGIGKTQIAVEYAYRHASAYVGRWWLDASTNALDTSAAMLAATLGIRLAPDTPPDQIARAVRQRLSSDKHLLILDNLEQADRLDDFLLPPPARVLATTRLHNLPTAHISDLAIPVFKRHESVALLTRHRPDLKADAFSADLDRVAEHLGDHALAVALSASYLRKHRHLTPGELLERLQKARMGEQAHLFERLEPREHTAGYALSVAASLSLHLPEFADTPAMDVLALAALCHPKDIPLELFYDALGLPREEVETWLVALADVSIIGYGQTVSIHRLMQEVVCAKVGPENERKALEALVGVLLERFAKPDDYRRWARQQPYALHAEAVVAHAERLGAVEDAGGLANQVGVYRKENAQYDAALRDFRIAEQIGRAAFGDEHADVATIVNNIGSVLRAKGDLDGALECYRAAERIDRAAERIDRAAFGDDHPNVATDVNNIGDVLQDKGDLDGALKCYREAERIDRAAFGAEHPNVAVCVNNIGSVLQDQGDLDGARERYREAERIDRAAFGDDHPEVATDVNNIGGVVKAKGDFDGALECYREAERIDRAAFGDDHPNVAIRVNNIGSTLQDKGDLDGALKCYREAERIDRAALGDDHPMVATDVNNIGSVLFKKGDPAGAAEHMERALRIVLKSQGPRSLQTLDYAENLLFLKVDVLAIARDVAGQDAADELARALEQRQGKGR